MMKRAITILFLVLGLVPGTGLMAYAGSNGAEPEPALRLLLSEVESGPAAGQQYCMLVFEDHHFHAEKAHRKMGKDLDRKVYQGQLAEADWTSLVGIIDSKEFRDLRVPRSAPPLVIADPHPYTISVARGSEFQSMEFLTKESLKPYEPQVKPLLKWWKAVRDAHLPESQAPVDSRCSLSNAGAVLGN